MSFVLRHKRTGGFLRRHDECTPEEREALQFTSGLRLVDYLEHGGAHEQLDAMEIIVRPVYIGTAGQGSGSLAQR